MCYASVLSLKSGKIQEVLSSDMNEQLLSIPVLVYQTEMVQCLAGVQPWGHARFSAVTAARH